MKLPLYLGFAALAVAAVHADEELAPAQIDARMLQMPAVSKSEIAFVYGGNIWIAPKAGGTALRLSTPRGVQQFPRFSPDGAKLAFTGNYDGNVDIYVMPVGGGEPQRITHHGGSERLLGWYPDGQSLLYESHMMAFTDRVGQLFKVPAQGGLPEKLPVAYGEFGAISPDGHTLAFTPISTDFATWKRYRGGMAPDIWLFDLEKKTAENVTHNEANDSQPMWHGETLYFISDRDEHERDNIWAYNTRTKETREVTHFTESDVHFPSVGPDDLVFENDGRLYVLDLGTEQMHEVKIKVATDRATLRPRVQNVAGYVRNAAISPTGKRALFEARGDIFSVPAEHGIVRDITSTSGVAERNPAWSPDGRWIAYFSDKTGEYELTIRPSDKAGGEETLTHLGRGFRYQPQWSPDAKKIVFVDQAMRIHLYDMETKQVTEVGRQLWAYEGDLARFRVSWSSDSRWFTYAADRENRQSAIVVYDTHEKRELAATSGFYDDDMPVFDPDGRYLYYRSKRVFEPIYSESDNTWIYTNGESLVALPLRKDVPSPLGPRDDEEPVRREPPVPEKTEEKKPEPAKDKKDEAQPKQSEPKKDKPEKPASDTAIEEQKPSTENAPAGDGRQGMRLARQFPLKPKPLVIDFDNIEARGVVLPAGGGHFDNLMAVPGKVIFRWPPRVGSRKGNAPLSFWDLEKRDEKMILDDCGGADLSADGKKLLVKKGDQWGIINVLEGQRIDKPLAVGSIEEQIDPPAEWRQIFNDAWRIERDFFYDPHMHGVDWQKMRTRYGRILEGAVTRSDVNHLLGELLGELNCSHTYRGGGDFDDGPTRSVGYLGCDYALEQGAYRIAHIIIAAPWDNVRSPLMQPGVNVHEGDWLLAVDGRPLDTKQDPWAAFQGLGDKAVMLTVNDKPNMEGSRNVLVQTLGSETALRHKAWVEANRRRVDAASGGTIGYIYVKNTGADGQSELYQQFRAQVAKKGLIVDERWNSGGQIPDRFIELLGRRVTNYWGVRDGRDWQTPYIAQVGPKVMLTNGWSGSGGDCFPWLFRENKLGPIIGTRTWGGLIGMTGAPSLIDGGHVTVPTFSIYDTSGKWIIEGHGVDPDIPVLDDPAELAQGHDPQLERAIEEVQKEMAATPPSPPKPPYPNRAGK
ncbi:peptidase S41 [Chthoniobacter flavus Ellin428]|uniref:Tricorn protease homolog n=1 Tax=Chthoniobacter flavus Ellin428 TaxID=497964 RepID=B4D285_9BACT|nr:S41 family peptidase [Chthoniobacter flavus]EDY19325.1 peptidase S41 [Chthoniobacter flavus Ellin428]TCO90544.1 tricorn protease [Chthoniobacter flavus]